MGCDRKAAKQNLCALQFQSTQPEWAATSAAIFLIESSAFQSTQPEWAATVTAAAAANVLVISIHAARVGCDRILYVLPDEDTIFQSTQPEWAATSAIINIVMFHIISIHAARVGCD